MNRILTDQVSDFTIFVYINFREQQAQAGEMRGERDG